MKVQKAYQVLGLTAGEFRRIFTCLTEAVMMLSRGDDLITCYIRYVISPGKEAEFEHYARLWIPLVEKLGGMHHGYFLPGEKPDSAAFSFPGIGEEGPSDVAVALFTFPSIAAYETYRERAAEDAECQAAATYYKETNCFLKYERSFMRPLFK